MNKLTLWLLPSGEWGVYLDGKLFRSDSARPLRDIARIAHGPDITFEVREHDGDIERGVAGGSRADVV